MQGSLDIKIARERISKGEGIIIASLIELGGKPCSELLKFSTYLLTGLGENKLRGRYKSYGHYRRMAIELGEVKEERKVLFASGDAEALSASALRTSHEPPLVNGRICEVKT